MPENPFDRYKEVGARDLMYREKAKVKPKSSVLDGLRDKKKDDGKAKSPDDMVQTPFLRKESDPPQYMKKSRQ